MIRPHLTLKSIAARSNSGVARVHSPLSLIPMNDGFDSLFASLKRA